MTKSLTLTIALALIGACTDPTDELVFEEEGGGKADVVRPYGEFRRTLPEGEAGFTMLTLNEDRSYDASQELVNCRPNECTDEFTGHYKFAASHGKSYVVLYNSGEWWYSFEYKLNGEKLSLRYPDFPDWFDLTRQASGLQLDLDDHQGTFDVVEGSDVVVNLPENPSSGYRWKVTSTDRTFGYGASSYTPGTSGAIGAPGVRSFTWKTAGALSQVGTHSVTIEYRRSWEDPTGAPAKTFTFTVDVAAGN